MMWVCNLYMEGTADPWAPSVSQRHLPKPRSPPLPLRPLQGLSHPGQSPMCLVQEPPALQSPAEGTPAPLDQTSVAPFSHLPAPFVITGSRGRCHCPSLPSECRWGSQPQPTRPCFIWALGLRLSKDQNQQKHKEWNRNKKSLKKKKKLKNY